MTLTQFVGIYLIWFTSGMIAYIPLALYNKKHGLRIDLPHTVWPTVPVYGPLVLIAFIDMRRMVRGR